MSHLKILVMTILFILTKILLCSYWTYSDGNMPDVALPFTLPHFSQGMGRREGTTAHSSSQMMTDPTFPKKLSLLLFKWEENAFVASPPIETLGRRVLLCELQQQQIPLAVSVAEETIGLL